MKLDRRTLLSALSVLPFCGGLKKRDSDSDGKEENRQRTEEWVEHQAWTYGEWVEAMQFSELEVSVAKQNGYALAQVYDPSCPQAERLGQWYVIYADAMAQVVMSVNLGVGQNKELDLRFGPVFQFVDRQKFDNTCHELRSFGVLVKSGSVRRDCFGVRHHS